MSNFQVLEGGIGAGTLQSFTVEAGGRTRDYTMRVSEPDPGRVLVETDEGSTLVRTTTVVPSGDTCVVQIRTTWEGAGGIGGMFERKYAPPAMRALYAAELAELDRYARSQT